MEEAGRGEKCENSERRDREEAGKPAVVKSSPIAAFDIDSILGIRNERQAHQECMSTRSPGTGEPRDEVIDSQIRPSRNRKNFSKEQRRQLEKLFEDSHYPDAFTREELAKKLGISQSRVQIWFQNRRAKIRRQQDHNHQKQPQDMPHFDHHYHQSLLRMFGYPSLHPYPQVGHSPVYSHVHHGYTHPQTALEQHYAEYWRYQQSQHSAPCEWPSRGLYTGHDFTGHP